jgi:hypothetical protein
MPARSCTDNASGDDDKDPSQVMSTDAVHDDRIARCATFFTCHGLNLKVRSGFCLSAILHAFEHCILCDSFDNLSWNILEARSLIN